MELVWDTVREEWECFWVNLREDNKVSENKIAVSESNMADFKMAESSGWVRMNEWSSFCAKWLNPSWQNSRWLPSSSWVRMNEWSSFCAKWLNPWWQSSRWLPSSSWVRMNEFESDWTSLSQSFVQHGWIQDGRIQDGRIQNGCHH